MKDDIRITATISFKSNLERLYPGKRNNKDRIVELNKILDDLIYGTKKK